ncbi:MAG TPA: SRPBCC domain-containing protein [Aggregatilineales bacterium]|nr:SRPBCC domain-containing protein [Aggregatilineales bacterium]
MTRASPDPTLSVSIRRTFKASRERVFRAWTDPEVLPKWFRPMGMETTVSYLELRIGGAYRFDYRAPDGERRAVTGKYLEIVRPEKLVFTWVSDATNDEETRVTVEFRDLGGSTEVILTHQLLADENMVYRHQQGWASVLDQLENAL